MTYFAREEVGVLHALVLAELQKPSNVCGRHHDDGICIPRKRQLDTNEMPFMIFDIFGGPNEGSQGLEHIALKFMSVASASNHFLHPVIALHRSLDSVSPRLIHWPDEEEREAMEGLLIGFPSSVFCGW